MINDYAYYDVMCPRCNSTFWEVWLLLPIPLSLTNKSRIRLCRKCAEELVKSHKDWEIKELNE